MCGFTDHEWFSLQVRHRRGITTGKANCTIHNRKLSEADKLT